MKSNKEIRIENLNNLIVEAGDRRGFCDKLLARELKIEYGYIGQLINGSRGIGDSVARKLEKLGGKPENWLDHTNNIKSTDNIHANTEPAPEIKGSVPLISWVQAGAWTEVIDNFHLGDAEKWIDTTANVSSQSFALRIKGDSMTNPHGTPSLPEGSMVIVDPHSHCDNGNIVVARLEDSMEATIKKLVIDGGQRYLKPLNPAYPTIPINGNCHIIGRAVRVELDL